MVTPIDHLEGANQHQPQMIWPGVISSAFMDSEQRAEDGKLHYFGDGPGQADLPMNGFYGIGSVDLEYQAAEMLMRDPAENLPTNPAGIYGKAHAPRPLSGSSVTHQWTMGYEQRKRCKQTSWTTTTRTRTIPTRYPLHNEVVRLSETTSRFLAWTIRRNSLLV